MKKSPKIDVVILEHAGDNDRFLVRYHMPENGLTATEWVSLAGVKQWIRTAKKTSLMFAIMNAIKTTIEEWLKKEAKKDDSIDSDTKENG